MINYPVNDNIYFLHIQALIVGAHTNRYQSTVNCWEHVVMIFIPIKDLKGQLKNELKN